MKAKIFLFCILLSFSEAYPNNLIYTANTGISTFHKKIVNNGIKIFFRERLVGNVGGDNFTYNENGNLVYIPYNYILKAFTYSHSIVTRDYYEVSNVDSNMILFFTFKRNIPFPVYDVHDVSYDYGLNYTTLNYIGNSFNQFKGFAIDPINDSIIYIASRFKHNLFNNDTTYIYKSFDRGLSFNIFDTLTIPVRVFYDNIFLKINPFNNSELFLSGVNNLIISIDSGRTFMSSNLPPFLNIHFNVLDSMIIGFTKEKIYMKKFGEDWDSTSQFIQGKSFINDVEFKDNNFFVANSEGIYKSTDFGKTFFLFNDAFINTENIIGISKLNTKDSLLVCTNNSLYLISDTSALVKISSYMNEIVNSYKLYQNYPNPFNPSTKITFELPKDSRVTLKIFDITGREIAVLLNNELRTTGRHIMDFNARGLASGVYFYRLEAEKFVQTRRMVLVK